tara:strand:+ start:405 stop:878 length:474 start_codon:yes stop_codon:yes gene_type:complete
MLLKVDNFFFKPLSLILLPFILLIQACSNTQIGKDLEKSFEPALNEVSEKINIESEPKTEKEISNKVKNNQAFKINRSNIKIDKNQQISTKKSRIRSTKLKFIPQPYRITIKLKAANPSAPAQSVTEALIDAGVVFEVEKIENIRNLITPSREKERR